MSHGPAFVSFASAPWGGTAFLVCASRLAGAWSGEGSSFLLFRDFDAVLRGDCTSSHSHPVRVGSLFEELFFPFFLILKLSRGFMKGEWAVTRFTFLTGNSGS